MAKQLGPGVSVGGQDPALPLAVLCRWSSGVCSPGSARLLELLAPRYPLEAALAAAGGFLGHFSSSTSDVHHPDQPLAQLSLAFVSSLPV